MFLEYTRVLIRAALITSVLVISCPGYQRTGYSIAPAQAPGDQYRTESVDDQIHNHHAEAAQKPGEKGSAQSQSKQEHQHPQNPAKKPTEQKDPHSEHDMSAMKKEGPEAGHEHEMMSTVSGGPFRSMMAIGSGTSLMPASSPGYMWHWIKDSWLLMSHGDIKVGFNHQGGPRGVNKAESQNWFMLTAERKTGAGQLLLRGMFSAEPWTAPRRGFPELFQTGETFEDHPIIDAQHPHDLFMELADAYNIPLTEKVTLNFYGGPVGESLKNLANR